MLNFAWELLMLGLGPTSTYWRDIAVNFMRGKLCISKFDSVLLILNVLLFEKDREGENVIVG